MGHTLICSYINDYIQYTPTVSSLQKQVFTFLIHLCSYMLSFAWTTWPSTYKPLSHAIISVLNLCQVHRNKSQLCFSFIWYLCPVQGRGGLSRALQLLAHRFIAESRRAPAQLGEDDRAEHPGTGNCMDVQPCNRKKSAQEVRWGHKRAGD